MGCSRHLWHPAHHIPRLALISVPATVAGGRFPDSSESLPCSYSIHFMYGPDACWFSASGSSSALWEPLSPCKPGSVKARVKMYPGFVLISMVRHAGMEMIVIKEEVYTKYSGHLEYCTLLPGTRGKRQGWSGGRRGRGEGKAQSLC